MTRSSGPGCLVVFVLVLAGLAGDAAAQSAEAEALFREGRQLLRDGKLHEACERFEASERLESSIGTLLNLGDCRERNQQLASAWAVFLKVAGLTARRGTEPQLEAEARRRAAALEPRLSYLTITVADRSRVDGLQIARDGTVLEPGLWNVALPIDAGRYRVTAQAPGHAAWNADVVVDREGLRVIVEVPRFERKDGLQDGSEPAMRSSPRPTGEAEPVRRPRFTGKRKLALGVAIAGAGLLGVGAARGLTARALRGEADRGCPETVCADPDALARNQEARTAAWHANVAFALGGSMVAGAVTLWVLGAPADAAPQVRVSAHPGGGFVSLSGRY